MPIVDLPGGGYAIVCTRGRRPITCSVCGKRGDKLCDFPLTGVKAGKTCDRGLCQKCAVHVEPDIDYCPAHARMKGLEQKTGSLVSRTIQ